MAGPTASILTHEFSEANRLWLDRFIHEISDSISGTDFWVVPRRLLGLGSSEGRPFLWEEQSPIDEEVTKELERQFGFEPTAEVIFGAMCNSAEDHRVLGRICEEAARRFEGIVSFGGMLPVPESCLRRGRVARIGEDLFGDAEFLSGWLAAPTFAMVK